MSGSDVAARSAGRDGEAIQVAMLMESVSLCFPKSPGLYVLIDRLVLRWISGSLCWSLPNCPKLASVDMGDIRVGPPV